MAVDRARLAAEVLDFRIVALDSVVLIYHLENILPYADLTECVFAAIADGSVSGILSTISLTELLVKPFAEKRLERIAAFERFVSSFPRLDLIPPDYSIAMRAAQLRASNNLRTPDALIAATALERKAAALLTNDDRLRKLSPEGIKVLVMDDYV